MNVRRILMLVLMAAVVCVMSAGVGAAAVITVDDSGGAMFMSIQAAIDAASLGDEIYVNSGTYYENVDVNKQLLLRGIDTDDGMPVVDGGGSGNVINITAPNVTIDKFLISGGDTGMIISSNDDVIKNNKVINNTFGISLINAFNVTVTQNSVESYTNSGIRVRYGGNLTIEKNKVSQGWSGIFIESTKKNNISLNYVSKNTRGIYLLYSTNNIVNNNYINNNSNGFHIFGAPGYPCTDNIIFNNNIINNTNQVNLFNGYSGLNFWDNGYDVGGNYWSDYIGIDGDSDGIGDTPYNITVDGGIQDRYPRMNPWGAVNISDSTIPILSIISPATNTTFNTSTITVSGTATDDTGVTSLTVNGNAITLETDGSFSTTVSLTSGVNTITVIATDAAGNSATETVTVTASLPYLVFAITPNSRLAQVGTPVTIFLSVINAGTGSATDVSISQASGLAATIGYQAWDGATLTGTPDTPVDIGAGATANFVLTINPTAEFASSPMTFDVSGTNSGFAPVSGVNILTMAASTTPYADVIMMSTSLDVSTAVNTATAFAVATTNVGVADATDVSLVVDIPSSITGLVYQVNETNPDGSIKGPSAGLTIPVGGTPTFAVFLTPTQAIDYDPANNRIVLKLVDGSGKVVGAQSVAVAAVVA